MGSFRPSRCPSQFHDVKDQLLPVPGEEGGGEEKTEGSQEWSGLQYTETRMCAAP